MTGKARHAHAATRLVLEALWSHVRPAVCVPEGASLGMCSSRVTTARDQPGRRGAAGLQGNGGPDRGVTRLRGRGRLPRQAH